MNITESIYLNVVNDKYRLITEFKQLCSKIYKIQANNGDDKLINR